MTHTPLESDTPQVQTRITRRPSWLTGLTALAGPLAIGLLPTWGAHPLWVWVPGVVVSFAGARLITRRLPAHVTTFPRVFYLQAAFSFLVLVIGAVSLALSPSTPLPPQVLAGPLCAFGLGFLTKAWFMIRSKRLANQP